MGAELRRFGNYSRSFEPVVRVVGYGCRLTGQGARISSELPAPMGIVHLGPGDKRTRTSVLFAHIEGLHITGHYHFDSPAGSNLVFKDIDSEPPWNSSSGYEQCGGWHGQVATFGHNGSVGLCMDST